MQKHYPPVVNIAGVLALLQSIVIFSLVNIILFSCTQDKVLPYHALVPFSVAMILYYFNEKYFEKKESQIVEEINAKPQRVKFFSHILTILVIVVLVWGYFFNGFFDFIFK